MIVVSAPVVASCEAVPGEAVSESIVVPEGIASEVAEIVKGIVSEAAAKDVVAGVAAIGGVAVAIASTVSR